MFTLKEEEHQGLPSLKKIYMEYEHVPGYEYEFATEVLGGWEHWQILCGAAIRNEVAQWRAELDVKLRAKAIKNIIYESVSCGKNAMQASKYLADKGYVLQENSTHSGSLGELSTVMLTRWVASSQRRTILLE